MGLVTGPHTRRPPHPQPVGSGPRAHAQTDGRSGVGECQSPDAPHLGKRRPPPGTLMPPPQRAKPARKSVRCGVGEGSPCPTSRTHSQWVVGPSRTPELTRGRRLESARPRTPHTQARGAPPGRPRAAPAARKASLQERALWGW